MTVVGRSIVRRPPVITAQVIEPGWLFGERNFGAHLERGRAAAPEDAFEADMPDHALGAHGAAYAGWRLRASSLRTGEIPRGSSGSRTASRLRAIGGVLARGRAPPQAELWFDDASWPHHRRGARQPERRE